MTQIVYYSIASTEITEDTISDILETSRVNNTKSGITGCLLYHNKTCCAL